MMTAILLLITPSALRAGDKRIFTNGSFHPWTLRLCPDATAREAGDMKILALGRSADPKGAPARLSLDGALVLPPGASFEVEFIPSRGGFRRTLEIVDEQRGFVRFTVASPSSLRPAKASPPMALVFNSASVAVDPRDLTAVIALNNPTTGDLTIRQGDLSSLKRP